MSASGATEKASGPQRQLGYPRAREEGTNKMKKEYFVVVPWVTEAEEGRVGIAGRER